MGEEKKDPKVTRAELIETMVRAKLGERLVEAMVDGFMLGDIEDRISRAAHDALLLLLVEDGAPAEMLAAVKKSRADQLAAISTAKAAKG